MMTLRKVTACGRWAFFFGDSLCRMGTGPMFHQSKADAVKAAEGQGLNVYRASGGRKLCVRVDPAKCQHPADAHVSSVLTTASGPVTFVTCDSCKTELERR